MQKESLKIASESFPGRKQFSLLLQENEIRGTAALERAAADLYGEEDPSEIFCRQEAFRMVYDPQSGLRSLLIALPYAAEDEIRVEKEENDLLLYVRSEVRHLRLPDLLCRRELSGWTFDNGELQIRFGYSWQK
jgi:arsenite-transporting ATPase